MLDRGCCVPAFYCRDGPSLGVKAVDSVVDCCNQYRVSDATDRG